MAVFIADYEFIVSRVPVPQMIMFTARVYTYTDGKIYL